MIWVPLYDRRERRISSTSKLLERHAREEASAASSPFYGETGTLVGRLLLDGRPAASSVRYCRQEEKSKAEKSKASGGGHHPRASGSWTRRIDSKGVGAKDEEERAV